MTARILIVEDNKANLEPVRYLLQFAGYSILAATDGEEGHPVARHWQEGILEPYPHSPGGCSVS